MKAPAPDPVYSIEIEYDDIYIGFYPIEHHSVTLRIVDIRELEPLKDEPDIEIEP